MKSGGSFQFVMSTFTSPNPTEFMRDFWRFPMADLDPLGHRFTLRSLKCVFFPPWSQTRWNLSNVTLLNRRNFWEKILKFDNWFDADLFAEKNTSLVVFRTWLLWLSISYMGRIIPTDELIFFRGVGQQPTSHSATRFLNTDILLGRRLRAGT